ncbi:DNA ligase [Shewanella glacialipiscicola]|uniref:DNA ligase n=1 Tax=Shewanella glacialipiscicola TaxID=614069 RepID=UPI00200D56E3|nr:DNA ligase [Shewanella glacialipiscicola]MCL1086717.1 DNA ligase [Shewanella glacialipiscicola]
MTHMIKLQYLTYYPSFRWHVFTLLLGLFHCLPALPAAQVSPPIQQASVFDGDKVQQDIHIKDFLISEKLDGVRGYWNGKALFTRQGYVITAPTWFTANFPDYPLDGELWLGRGQFEAMSSLIRQSAAKEEDWRKVRFMVFDVPKAGGDFISRYQFALTELSGKSNYLEVIKQFQLESLEALYQKLDTLVAKGAEGLMLHRSSAMYMIGRNPNLMKLKPYYDAEALVIAHIPGKGQFAGQMGALRVQTPDGRVFSIGTGFSLAQRQHPPAVGVTITYKYLGLTVNGLPRFASFLRIRSDVTTNNIQ